MFKTKKLSGIAILGILSLLCFLFAFGLWGTNISVSATELPTRTVGRYVSVQAKDLEWNGSNNRQDNGVCIGDNGLNLYPGKNGEMASLTYTIPSTSTITKLEQLSSTFYLSKDTSNATFGFRILHNDKVIYPSDGGWQVPLPYKDKNGNQNATYKTEAQFFNYPVKAGDVFRFVAKADWTGTYQPGLFIYSTSYIRGNDGKGLSGNTLKFINPANALNADGTAKTREVFGGTYTYAEVQRYEEVIVTDLIKDSVEFTQEGFNEKFIATPASWCAVPSFASENDENYVHYETGWSVAEYKSTIKDYKLSTSFRLFGEPDSDIDFGLYFNSEVPYNLNNNNVSEQGHIFHFYQGETVMYNTTNTTGWYTASQKIAQSSGDLRDGNWHNLSITCLDNKYYVAIDDNIFFATITDFEGNGGKFVNGIYTNDIAWEDTYVRFVGKNFDIKKFEIDYFSRDDKTASAQFTANYDLYEEFKKYDSADYEDRAFQMLIDEFNKGMANIFNATTETDVNASLISAKEDMALIPYALNETLVGYYVEGVGYNGLYGVDTDLSDANISSFSPVYVKILMNEGASIRINEPAGIRFITSVETAGLNKLDDLGINYSFGTYVLKAEDITQNGELDYSLIPDVEKKLDIYATVTYIDGDNTMFNGTLTDIKDNHYDWDFTGVGYININYADGTSARFYAKPDDNVRSIKTVSYKAYNDFSDTKTDEYKYETENGYSLFDVSERETLQRYFNNGELLTPKTNPNFGETSIHFIDVANVPGRFGAASSILILHQDKAMLIDAGTDLEPSTSKVMNYLDSFGVERIDHLIVTHSHYDHTGGMPTIIDNYDIGTIYAKPLVDWALEVGDNDVKEQYEAVIAAGLNKINSNGIKTKIVEPTEEGQTFYVDEDTYFKAFNCTRLYTDRLAIDYNHLSQQYLFVSGTAKAHFAGDATSMSDEFVLDNLGKVDIFAMQHHGDYSPTYNSPEIFAELQPTYSVAQANANTPPDSTRVLAEQYGYVMNTGTDGILVFNKVNGKFVYEGKPADYLADAKTVSIEETLIPSVSGASSITTEDGNEVFNQALQLVGGKTTSTAFVLTVPENFPETATILFKDSLIYNYSGKDKTARFCIVQNDKLVYGDNGGWFDLTEYDTDNRHNFNLLLKATAGDKIYIIVDGDATVYATMGMRISGVWFDATNVNHIDSANDNVACTKNFFNGTFFNNAVYTRAEIVSYMQVKVSGLN